MKRCRLLTALLGLVLFVTGCGGREFTTLTPAQEEALNEEIPVEAYLFDSRLYRDGKPTSVRLEMYQTESVVGLAGRGYLGKGALKGRLTADSIEVYFPTKNEYLYESVSDLMGSFDCTGDLPQVSLFALLANLPDQVLDTLAGVTIAADRGDESKPMFVVSTAGCPWQLELTYDFQDKGWRISEFVFSDDGEIVLKGNRRQYKHDTTVKRKRFAVPVKIGAVRITP